VGKVSHPAPSPPDRPRQGWDSQGPPPQVPGLRYFTGGKVEARILAVRTQSPSI
jgi:hypothetical protein